MKYVRMLVAGFILSLVLCLQVRAAGSDEPKDGIKILSITPNQFKFYEPVTFTVYVEYTLSTREEGIINISFNTEKAASYETCWEEGSFVIMEKGTGRVTLQGTVSPIDWSEPAKLAGFWINNPNAGNKIIDDFRILVMLSDYTSDKLVPLAWEDAAIEDLPETDPEDFGQDFQEIDIDHLAGSTTIKWGSELFKGSSTEFNRELAKVASVLCAAAENKEVDLDPFTIVYHYDQADLENLVQELIKYSKTNIQEAYLKLGFQEDGIALFSYPQSRFNVNDVCRDNNYFARDDSFAFSIASMPLKMDGEEGHLVVITARGSKTPYEFGMDALTSAKHYFLGCRVYDVVYEYEEDMYCGLDYYFNQHQELREGKLKFLITGHSLGGAAVNLLAARLTKISVGEQFQKEDIYVYTFGAIDSLYEQNLKNDDLENIHNVYNVLDTFGPFGNGIFTAAGNSGFKKFGSMEYFMKDYRSGFNPVGFMLSVDFNAQNHVIGNYVKAMISEGIQIFRNSAVGH